MAEHKSELNLKQPHPADFHAEAAKARIMHAVHQYLKEEKIPLNKLEMQFCLIINNELPL